MNSGSSTSKKILVVGQGYVGLPLAMRAVEVGYQVAGFDLDVRRVSRLAEGVSFVEDVDTEVLKAALQSGRYSVSADEKICSDFDVAVITVPTPLRETLPDLSFIESAAATLAKYLQVGATVVLESTTYPGTTEELMIPILESGSGLKAGTDFFVGYSPERIDPGNRVWTFTTTPKVVSGVNAESLDRVAGFYANLVDRVVPVKGCKEAELTKLLENTFRHVNVALVNELAVFATELGIDVWDAIDAATTKPFGYMRFTPGPGVGGHCLPIDPSYLSWRVRQTLGRSFRFVELANDVNEHMPDHVVSRVMLTLNEDKKAINGAKIVTLGLAYKPNSSDARESPSVVVATKLAHLGADVTAIDPHVVDHPHGLLGVNIAPTFDAAMLKEADMVVVLTDHAAFDYELVVASSRRIFDTRRKCAPAANVEFL